MPVSLFQYEARKHAFHRGPDQGLLPQPGAVDVFLDFISYSGGPLPEELLPRTACPVSILWGEADPWEPIELGRAYGDFDCVEEFIPLPGTSHICFVAISVCLAAFQL